MQEESVDRLQSIRATKPSMIRAVDAVMRSNVTSSAVANGTSATTGEIAAARSQFLPVARRTPTIES